MADDDNPLSRFAAHGRNAQDSVDRILARTRERMRRKKLEGQLERQERKLDSLGPIGPTTPMLRRNRAFRLLGQIKKLRAQLAQPELML